MLQATDQVLHLARARFRLGMVERHFAIERSRRFAQPSPRRFQVTVVQLGGETEQACKTQDPVAMAGIERLPAVTPARERRDRDADPPSEILHGETEQLAQSIQLGDRQAGFNPRRRFPGAQGPTLRVSSHQRLVVSGTAFHMTSMSLSHARGKTYWAAEATLDLGLYQLHRTLYPEPPMAVRKILKFPDPKLKDTALVVRNIDAQVDALVTDMLETMYAAPGVGLAAPQLGINERVIVLDVGEEKGKEIIKLVNPVVAEKEGSIIWEEGCLSVVDFTENVQRASHVLVKAWTPDEKEIEIDAEGFLAVALQHEIDHLDGKLFIDRISRLKRDIYKRRVKKWIRDGVPLEDKGPPSVHI